MGRPTFRLANVLRLRRLQEDIARAEAGEAGRAAAAADRATEQRVDALRARLGNAPAVSTSHGFLATHEDHHRHAVAVRAAWAAAATAHELHRQRLDAVVEAAKRVAALEKLEERVRRQREELVLHAEARELDDIVTSRRPRDDT
jgi:hypothetical protein